LADRVLGFLNINKPAGMTSHDVVSKVRRQTRKTGTKKVGHAGTLDPMATGVLILCLGHATRLSEYAMQSTKKYRAIVSLGQTTDTYDAEGETLVTRDASHITEENVLSVLDNFRGHIEQVPPMYSAIKQDGKKLYELARDGVEVERLARPVTIHELNIVAWDLPQFTLDVVCSAGTYIRSLAYDIGEKLDVGAHLAGLIRTASGAFSLENAVDLDAVIKSEDWQQYLIPPQQALADWKSIQLTDAQINDVTHGRFIEHDDTIDDEYVMAFMPNGHLLAVMQQRDTYWKPHKVFLPDN
jgi:tRNA pseudouridine55 synthase